MIKRFYITLAAIPLLSLIGSCLFASFSGQTQVIPIIILTDVLILGLVQMLGAYYFFRPIAAVLQGGEWSEAAGRRIRMLPKAAAVWLIPLIVLRWLILIVVGFNELPIGDYSGIALLMRFAAELWWMIVGAIYFPLIIYFAIGDYVSDLRARVFEEIGVNMAPRDNRLSVELMVVFLLLVSLPMITVLLDVLYFAPAREVLGVDLKTHVTFDVITSLVAVSLAIFFVVRDLTRPLEALSAAVARVSDGDLDSLMPVTTDDDIGRLTVEFNELIEDIRERNFIRETFGKFVPPSMVPQLLAEKGRLGGEERIASMIFSDIEGFSTIVENMTPQQTIAMLNEYFGVVLPVIRARGGVINAMIGDAVFAAFNVPIEDEDHAAQAVAASIDIQNVLAGRTFAHGVSLKTRVGVNTGLVVAGSVGSKDRMSFTLLGDEVNIAARIEQLNKEVGTYILVSEDTYRLTKERFDYVHIGERQMKGKVERLHIYQVLY